MCQDKPGSCVCVRACVRACTCVQYVTRWVRCVEERACAECALVVGNESPGGVRAATSLHSSTPRPQRQYAYSVTTVNYSLLACRSNTTIACSTCIPTYMSTSHTNPNPRCVTVKLCNCNCNLHRTLTTRIPQSQSPRVRSLQSTAATCIIDVRKRFFYFLTFLRF